MPCSFFFDETRKLSLLYRRLETCGKPFAAAMHGVCLGGAFELALACHFRVPSDVDTTRVGLPEVKVGLFPGAGGTQRVARLMQTGDALQMLFKGEQIRSYGAQHGPRPCRSRRAKGSSQRRRTGSARRLGRRALGPEGLQAAVQQGLFRGRHADLAAGQRDLPPRDAGQLSGDPRHSESVYQGLQLPMDLALKVESRWFAKILRSKEAAAMIRTLFISMQDLNKGARRPEGRAADEPEEGRHRRRGLHGRERRLCDRQCGLEVVLIDRDMEAAEKGKAHSHKLMSDQIMKGRAKTADRDALLARITPSADYNDLKDCDLVIEAVFEDPKVKAEVIQKVEAAIRPDCIFASNTSTLPISGSPRHSKKPDQFIGIHFFSPVEKMMLVEIIMGKDTGDKALATALDYVRRIKKTPIVVNDSRGFFANRCVLAYILEGHLMFAEGLPAAMIEQAGKQAGMPVGPLSLNDEVGVDLGLKILRATKAQLGEGSIVPEQEQLLTTLVEKEGRLGRKNRKGFYDYPEGGQKRLWPGLKDLQTKHLEPERVDMQELKQRLLVTQAWRRRAPSRRG